MMVMIVMIVPMVMMVINVFYYKTGGVKYHMSLILG